MIDVKELVRRWAAGHGIRKIARETGTDRGTVARYVAVARQLGLPPGHTFDDDEVHEVAQRVQARPLRDASAEWSEVAQHRERIVEWLGRKRPLRMTKIHTLLVREHGLEASYDTLRRYATQELDWRRKAPTVRLDDPPPGQEAQVDFGKMGLLVDAETARRRTLWALVVTLSFSRYQFVWPTFTQTTEAVCEGLDRAWWFFGAMPKTIVPDNTRAMVKDPDALNPTLVAAFLDRRGRHGHAQHRQAACPRALGQRPALPTRPTAQRRRRRILRYRKKTKSAERRAFGQCAHSAEPPLSPPAAVQRGRWLHDAAENAAAARARDEEKVDRHFGRVRAPSPRSLARLSGGMLLLFGWLHGAAWWQQARRGVPCSDR
jgi:transposase